MRQLSITLTAVCAAVLLALGWSGSVRADILNSPHDMVNNPNVAITTTGTTQICKFCHFPHNFLATAPLWNRTDPVTTAWSPYSSTTLQNTPGNPTGVSLACLSCHDGATAIDSLNQLAGETIVTTVNGVPSGDIADLATTNANIGGGGATGDLSDDHPVSISVVGDPAINAPATITGGGLTLYGAGADEIQCASCHDPHNTTNTPFLRIANANSALCTTCHQK